MCFFEAVVSSEMHSISQNRTWGYIIQTKKQKIEQDSPKHLSADFF